MKKKVELILLFLMVGGVVFWSMHLWISDRRGVIKAFYPVEAALAALGGRCNKAAPEWLEFMLSRGIWGLAAEATQIAYIDAEGNVSHCESGGVSGWFSDKVTPRTRYRYGSLTKPITSATVLYIAKNFGLSLQSPVTDFWVDESQMVDGIGSVTIDMLLRHQSGISGDVFSGVGEGWCPYNMKAMKSVEVHRLTGHEFKYSNLGYCILGEIVASEVGGTYRSAIEEIWALNSRGITFSEYEKANDEVERDYRFNDFYGSFNHGRFDYYAISSTAGMSGSATAYAKLVKDIQLMGLEGFIVDDIDGCDTSVIRNCYGRAFYVYRTGASDVLNVKEGYMPGAAGVVAINQRGEVFVWLGNSDTPNSADGKAMKNFLDDLAKTGF